MRNFSRQFLRNVQNTTCIQTLQPLYLTWNKQLYNPSQQFLEQKLSFVVVCTVPSDTVIREENTRAIGLATVYKKNKEMKLFCEVEEEVEEVEVEEVEEEVEEVEVEKVEEVEEEEEEVEEENEEEEKLEEEKEKT
ncbi:hypothetical protein Pcinc_012891 [Petrolisthes cinctipes]|uniref:Uncharacterized protein n=1 Tax=Petrolisthes cinctipes TaxID=88211 RepID=A0AAE1KSU6_PETCI|nr:hypothetical protein Pcinc_012891 [Petrolisthes cinctipes]